MAMQSLMRPTEKMPMLFDDFFKPWNEWFGEGNNGWNKMLRVPPVNITENKGNFKVVLAVPGMKKEDLKIDLDGNMLTISSEKEEKKEENDEKFTRKEFSFYSFSRSFTLPEDVDQEKIEANYHDGELTLMLPKKEGPQMNEPKKISIS